MERLSYQNSIVPSQESNIPIQRQCYVIIKSLALRRIGARLTSEKGTIKDDKSVMSLPHPLIPPSHFMSTKITDYHTTLPL